MGGLSSEPIYYPHVPQTERVAKIGDNRLSTSFGVVEWPDHHCGNDLVEIFIWLEKRFYTRHVHHEHDDNYRSRSCFVERQK